MPEAHFADADPEVEAAEERRRCTSLGGSGCISRPGDPRAGRRSGARAGGARDRGSVARGSPVKMRSSSCGFFLVSSRTFPPCSLESLEILA